MVRPELLQGRLLIFGNTLAELAHLKKEIFHAASGLKQDQHLALSLADLRKRVRNLPRCKRRIARAEMKRVAADLDDKFPADHIKPFVLKVMSMQGRPAFLPTLGVIDEKVAARITTRYLQIKMAAHDQQLFIAPILLGADTEARASPLRRGRL